MNFLCFEGIDGSGKTTLSEMVRERLLENGYKVIHLREGKDLVSPVANTIRLMAKDPANMTLHHWPEFFLYLAREKQSFDEKVKDLPHDDSLFVIADRSMFSPLVMAKDIRGIQSPLLEPLIDELWEGSEPSVVFFCDVDLDVSQTRKKIGKFSEPSGKINSRKGLWGLRFREKMRQGYLRLAKERSNWVHIDNNGQNTDFAFASIWNTLKTQFGVQSKQTYPKTKFQHSLQGHINLTELPQAQEQFSQILEQSHPYLQGYLLNNLYSDFWKPKIQTLVKSHPEAALLALKGRAPEAFKRPIIEKLWPQEKLRKQWVKSLDVPIITWEKEFLQQAFSSEPVEVLFALKNCNEPWAYDLREKAWKKHSKSVLETLSRLDDSNAWEFRQRVFSKGKVKKKWADSMLLGLSYLNSEQAWDIRDTLYQDHQWSTLLSLKGCFSPKSYDIRNNHIKQAPKLVQKSLTGLSEPEAWKLRQKSLGAWPELLQGIKDIDHPEAQKLREYFWSKAPHLVLSSLGLLYYKTEMLENEWVQRILQEKKNTILTYKSILAKEEQRNHLEDIL